MAEPRPSTSSDDTDSVNFRPAFARQVSKELKWVARGLVQNGAVTQKSGNKVNHHVATSKRILNDTEVQGEELSEPYLQFNRMRQEQNYFKKMLGPNYLEAILAKPKARLPDINDDDIDAYDDGGIQNQDEENLDVDGKPIYEAQRGTLRPGAMETINAEFESFDYTETSSALRYIEGTKRTALTVLRVDFMRWPIAFFIGFVTSCVALAILYGIDTLTLVKYRVMTHWFQKTYTEHDPIVSYLISIAINMTLCFCATLCCVFAPEAVGSGIPQIKSYLNGVNIPRLMRFKTLMGKVVGVIFSVSGGLAVGKEGPMIHSGAVVAAGLSQGKATSLPITTKYNKAYRTDKEKRDFVACGAAAGVASAFGAPLGGLLFAIEEGASYINHSTLWRVAMSAITSYFILNITSSIIKGYAGNMSNGGLISFGEFDNASYTFFQLIVFFFMGIFGGLLGALFNLLNTKLTQFRVQRLASKWSKGAEAVCCGLTVSTIAFCSMYMVDDCRAYDVDIMNRAPVRLYCQDGKASAAAALWYKTPEETVRSLFHDPQGAHSFLTLLVFFMLYFVLACWTYGMFISSGLFVPSLLIGASWGRLVGMGLFYVFPTWDWGDLGKYALIGASAQLAGTVRLTYSLTAIILEATGNLTYIFPIFVTVFMAKIIGDFLNEGIYDIHINILGIPLLPYQPKVDLRSVTAKDMMNDKVKYLNIRSRVSDVVDVLEETTHNAFPIVDTELKLNSDGTFSFGRLRGLMLRHDIVAMLQHEIFVENGRFGAAESYAMLREKYPRFTKLQDFEIPDEHMEMTMDFSNAVNSAPYTAVSTMSMPAVYSLFRNMGMRHLVVVNLDNEVIGMITRKEIAALEPEFTPFPKTKITLYKKTSIIPHKRTFDQRRSGTARKRRITFTNFQSYERL